MGSAGFKAENQTQYAVKRIVPILLVSLAAASQLDAQGGPPGVPFEPTASLGLGLLGALVGYRFFRRLKTTGFKKRPF